MPKDSRYHLFCKILIEARIKSNLTQVDIANRLGKPQSFVSKYETGERRLDFIEVIDVCHAIGFSPITIIHEIEEHDEY